MKSSPASLETVLVVYSLFALPTKSTSYFFSPCFCPERLACRECIDPADTLLSAFFLLVSVSGRHWHQFKGRRRERLRYSSHSVLLCCISVRDYSDSSQVHWALAILSANFLPSQA